MLNNKLHKEVYIASKVNSVVDQVFKLKRARLKQAPRAYYEIVYQFLVAKWTLLYSSSLLIHIFYLYKLTSMILFLDLLAWSYVESFQSLYKINLKWVRWENWIFSLGYRWDKWKNGFINQAKYTKDLIKCFGMEN